MEAAKAGTDFAAAAGEDDAKGDGLGFWLAVEPRFEKGDAWEAFPPNTPLAVLADCCCELGVPQGEALFAVIPLACPNVLAPNEGFPNAGAAFPGVTVEAPLAHGDALPPSEVAPPKAGAVGWPKEEG